MQPQDITIAPLIFSRHTEDSSLDTITLLTTYDDPIYSLTTLDTNLRSLVVHLLYELV